MTPKITDEQREAILAGHGQPVDVEDEQTHTRYVLVDQETHERAIFELNGGELNGTGLINGLPVVNN